MDNMNRYRVSAQNKSGSVVEFIVSDVGYKQGWTNGRNACRFGTEVESLEGERFSLTAGEFKVRSVFALDKKRASSKKLTAAEFLRVAQEKGITPSKRLRELIEELGVEIPSEEAPAEVQA